MGATFAGREWTGERAMCYTKLSKEGNREEGLMVVDVNFLYRGRVECNRPCS